MYIDTRSNLELREANRSLREFLAVLGHELCNPLAAIRYSMCLLERLGDDAASRERVHSVVERQTLSITRMVEDLREVARIGYGKIPLRKETLDLADAIHRSVETVRCLIEDGGHRLELTLPPEPVCLDADPDQLEQVLTNLLTNATKYMEPGGCIWLTAGIQGDEIVLSVRDSGVGIASEMLAHVFDPFWQAEITRDRSRGGLGIGLALVRAVAELHGGSASVHSDGLGCGSEFVVRLPANAGRANAEGNEVVSA